MDVHRDRLVIDFYDIETRQFSEITAAVGLELFLYVAGPKRADFDNLFQDLKMGADILSPDRNNGSGYIVHKKTESPEPIVRKIAGFISAKFISQQVASLLNHISR